MGRTDATNSARIRKPPPSTIRTKITKHFKKKLLN